MIYETVSIPKEYEERVGGTWVIFHYCFQQGECYTESKYILKIKKQSYYVHKVMCNKNELVQQ